MPRKFILLLLMLALIGGSLFAAIPESWINNSITYTWPYNSELNLSSGSHETIGYNFSWFAFPGSSSVGVATHLGLTFSLDANPAFTGMHAFMGPAFNTVLAGGVIGYAAIGPSYNLMGYETPTSFMVQQLGIGMDVGARFTLAGSERWDLGVIVGAFGDITLIHLVNSMRSQGFSANISGYFGFSFGSAINFPYSPSVYYYF